MTFDKVSRRICKSAGLDSFARRKEGKLIELKREMSFEDDVVERDFRCGDTFARVRRKVGYNNVRFPLLVAMRLYIDYPLERERYRGGGR
jgi:hypothetical protein